MVFKPNQLLHFNNKPKYIYIYSCMGKADVICYGILFVVFKTSKTAKTFNGKSVIFGIDKKL